MARNRKESTLNSDQDPHDDDDAYEENARVSKAPLSLRDSVQSSQTLDHSKDNTWWQWWYFIMEKSERGSNWVDWVCLGDSHLPILSSFKHCPWQRYSAVVLRMKFEATGSVQCSSCKSLWECAVQREHLTSSKTNLSPPFHFESVHCSTTKSVHFILQMGLALIWFKFELL